MADVPPWELSYDSEPQPQGAAPAQPTGPPAAPWTLDYGPAQAPTWGDVGWDVAKSIPAGITRGIVALPGLPMDLAHLIEAGTDYIDRKFDLRTPEQRAQIMERRAATDNILPTGQQVVGAFERNVSGPLYKAQTTPGKFAETASEFAGGAAVVPGLGALRGTTPISRIGVDMTRYGVAPALTSEAAGQAAKGTEYETAARLGGAFAGPAAASAVRSQITRHPTSQFHLDDVRVVEDALGTPVMAGQRTGERNVRYLESESGTAGQLANERLGEGFTRWVYEQFGQPGVTRSSQATVDNAFRTLGQQYDDLARNNPVIPDRQLHADAARVQNNYTSVTGEGVRAPIVNTIANGIQSMTGPIHGPQYQAVTSLIERQARGAGNSGNWVLADALRGLRRSLDDAMERSISANNPADLGRYHATDRNYANLIRAERALATAADGLVSPLALRTQLMSGSENLRNYSRGRGDFDRVVNAAANVLKPLPDSGTASRVGAKLSFTSPGAIIGGAIGGGGGTFAGGLPGGITGAGIGASLGGAIGRGLGNAAVMSPLGQRYLGNQLMSRPAEPISRRMATGGLVGGTEILAEEGAPPSPLRLTVTPRRGAAPAPAAPGRRSMLDTIMQTLNPISTAQAQEAPQEVPQEVPQEPVPAEPLRLTVTPRREPQPTDDDLAGRGVPTGPPNLRPRLTPRDDPRGLEGYIRERAMAYGIDPDTAVRVAQSEGLRTFLGDGGQSGGAFQLYTGSKGGGGLGGAFQRDTGLNPLDPANERATIDYALRHASQHGWTPWYGAQKIGVQGFDGIGGRPLSQRPPVAEDQITTPGMPHNWNAAAAASNLTPEQNANLGAIAGIPGASTQEIYHRLAMPDTKPGDLMRAKSAMGPVAWQEFSGTKIRSLGRQFPKDPFNPEAFAQAWAATAPGFKSLLAPAHRKAIDNVIASGGLERLAADTDDDKHIARLLSDPQMAEAMAAQEAREAAAGRMRRQTVGKAARPDAGERMGQGAIKGVESLIGADIVRNKAEGKYTHKPADPTRWTDEDEAMQQILDRKYAEDAAKTGIWNVALGLPSAALAGARGAVGRFFAPPSEGVGPTFGAGGGRGGSRRPPTVEEHLGPPPPMGHNQPPPEAALPPPSPKKGRQQAITAVSLRDLDFDEALRIAKTERHILPSPQGGFVGAPEWVDTPEKLALMRATFDKAVDSGSVGRNWYEDVQRFIKDIAGNDPAKQSLASRELALWSAQSHPDPNLNEMIRAHNAFEMGVPLEKARTGAQARTYTEARLAGTPVRLGKKTGVYAGHMDPTVSNPVTGTNDIWHARAFSFTKKGKPWDGQLTPQQHAFLDAETILAVERANARAAGGVTDWTPGKVQAAPWVSTRATGYTKRFPKKYPTFEEALPDAAKSYPDYVPKYTARGTYEGQKGLVVRHLPGEGPTAAELRTAWTTPEGHDVLAQAAGMYQRPSIPAQGVFVPPKGPVEFNPAMVSRPLVGFTGPSGKRVVDPVSHAGMNAIEALRTVTGGQAAGAWSLPVFHNQPGRATSLYIPHQGPLPVETMTALREVGARHQLPGVVDYGEGAVMSAFGQGGPNAAQLRKALDKGLLGEEVRAIAGTKPVRAEVQGDYLDFVKQWKRGEGSGAVTRKMFTYINDPAIPRMMERLDDPAVREAIGRQLERDLAVAAQTDKPVRRDLLNLLDMIANDGLPRAWQAVKRREFVPAIGGALATAAILRDRQRESE